MISSYILSTTLVPVMAVSVLKPGKSTAPRFDGVASIPGGFQIDSLSLARSAGVHARKYCVIWLLYPRIGTELFPSVDFGQFALRIKAPTGTRVEETELIALRTLRAIEQEVGKENIDISTAFIGTQPSSYPVNLIHLWTGGPHEALMQVALKPQQKSVARHFGNGCATAFATNFRTSATPSRPEISSAR